MSSVARIAPPNSVVLLSDAGNGEIPTSMAGSLIASTASTIAVGCRSEADGETVFVLGSAREVDPGVTPDFEGKLTTPNKTIALKTVYGVTILQSAVNDHQTLIRIWVNHPVEPDEIIIGLVEP